MSVIPADSGNPNRDLQVTDYKPSGELKTLGADVALVVGSASRSEAFIQNKQWGLLWRDSDLNIMGSPY
jgi:hypothetical protein